MDMLGIQYTAFESALWPTSLKWYFISRKNLLVGSNRFRFQVTGGNIDGCWIRDLLCSPEVLRLLACAAGMVWHV